MNRGARADRVDGNRSRPRGSRLLCVSVCAVGALVLTLLGPTGADAQIAGAGHIPSDVRAWLISNPNTIQMKQTGSGGSVVASFDPTTASLGGPAFNSAPPAVQAWLQANASSDAQATKDGSTAIRFAAEAAREHSAASAVTSLNAKLAELEAKGYTASDEYDSLQNALQEAINVRDQELGYLKEDNQHQWRLDNVGKNLTETDLENGDAATDAAINALIQAQLSQLKAQIARTQPQSTGLNNLIDSGSEFGSLQLQQIYNGSQLANYQGPSSAGISGYSAVPWLSQSGTGVSSGGPALNGSNLSNSNSAAALCGN